MTFNNVLPADVETLKVRLNPSIQLVSARVKSAPTLPRDLRAQWQAFAEDWAAFFSDRVVLLAPRTYEHGIELETKLRDLRSVLSSQCPGVTAPAARRPASFFGTWASPHDVRAQKERVDPMMREMNLAVAARAGADADLVRCWGELFRGWVSFFNGEDSWIHGATLYEAAAAYEDTLPEWRDALDGVGTLAPSPQPTRAALGPATFDPSPPFIAPNAESIASLERRSGMAVAVLAVGSLLAIAVAFSRRRG